MSDFEHMLAQKRDELIELIKDIRGEESRLRDEELQLREEWDARFGGGKLLVLDRANKLRKDLAKLEELRAFDEADAAAEARRRLGYC